MHRLVVVLAVVACSSSSSSSSPSDAVLTTDLEVLCGRAASRSASAWSQPTVQTAALGDLTRRVDRGEDAARCDLGRLMRRHARHACRGSSPSLVASCSG